MDLNNFVNKNKNMLLNIGVIVLALMISANIFKKQTLEIDSLKQRKEKELQKSVTLEGIAALDKKIASYKNLLGKKDASSVMSSLNNLARETQVTITAIRPSGEQKGADYTQFPFELTVSCPDYRALGEFISRLENFQDVFVVDALDINTASGRGMSVSLKISLIVYAN